MAYVIQFIIEAERDVQEIYDFLAAQDSFEAADAIMETLILAYSSLAELPLRGHFTPEMLLYGVQAFREIHSGPYRLIYEVRGQAVYVHAVLDARRDLRDLLLARLIR